jgi:hypothetical protein
MIKPTLQALILADNIYQDRLSGKMIIAGTFNRINFKKNIPKVADLPNEEENALKMQRKLAWHEIYRSGSPYAYISLTNARGPIPLELRYLDLADNTVLFVVQFSVNSEDPLTTIETIIPVPPLPTPHAGVYALELASGSEILGSHRITAVDTSVPLEQAGG